MSDAPADPRLFYNRHIFICTNTRAEGHPRGSCSARAADAGGVEKCAGICARRHGIGCRKYSVQRSGCLDRCEYGPNMVIYPEGVWYRYENTHDIDEIVETHLKNGGRVERLMLTPDQLPPKH